MPLRSQRPRLVTFLVVGATPLAPHEPTLQGALTGHSLPSLLGPFLFATHLSVALEIGGFSELPETVSFLDCHHVTLGTLAVPSDCPLSVTPTSSGPGC